MGLLVVFVLMKKPDKEFWRDVLVIVIFIAAIIAGTAFFLWRIRDVAGSGVFFYMGSNVGWENLANH